MEAVTATVSPSLKGTPIGEGICRLADSRKSETPEQPKAPHPATPLVIPKNRKNQKLSNHGGGDGDARNDDGSGDVDEGDT